jgi:hypothetical protein
MLHIMRQITGKAAQNRKWFGFSIVLMDLPLKNYAILQAYSARALPSAGIPPARRKE